MTAPGTVRYRIAAIGVTQETQTRYIDDRHVGVLPSIIRDIDKKTSLTLLGNDMDTPGAGRDDVHFPAIGTIDGGPEGRIDRSTFLGLRDSNVNRNKAAMVEYLLKHRFNKTIEFDQTFRYEESREHNDNFSFSGLSADDTTESEYITPWRENISNKTIGLDSRLPGKFHAGSVSHTWIVGSDFRDHILHSNTIWDFGADQSVNVYNPAIRV